MNRMQRYFYVLAVLAVWPLVLVVMPTASRYKDNFFVPAGAAMGWDDAAANGIAGRIPILVVDQSTPESLIPIRGSPSLHAVNVAAIQAAAVARKNRSRAAIDKTKAWLAWLEKEKSNHGDKLAILIDSSDIQFGGCSEAEILARYSTIVRASGNASVVMGAQLQMSPEGTHYQTHRYREFTERVQDVLHAAGLESTPAWEGQEMKFCSGRSCSSRYMFANYGFLVGPVSSLTTMLSSIRRAMAPSWFAAIKMLWNPKIEHPHADQGEASLYMFSHPHIVTLDYSMSIVANVDLFKESSLILKAGGRLYNSVTNRVQCFVQ